MTDLAVRNDSTAVEQAPSAQPAFRDNPLVEWAFAARQAQGIAASLAKTSFVPASLKGKPDDITAAILAGQELGLQPMATLRSMDVIQGTPALRAHAMRGLLQSHGHSIQLVESTRERCVMRGKRKEDTDWQVVEWDLARAAEMGLTGKSEWKKQPKTMLVARATGEICRLVASDVLYAMPYNAEEMRDGIEPDAVTAQASVADLIGAPAEAPVSGVPMEPEPMSEQQTGILAGLFSEAGMSPNQMRAFVTDTIGRQIAHRGDLSASEADRVIVALTQMLDARRAAEVETGGAELDDRALPEGGDDQ